MNENSTIEVSAFPDPNELREILEKFESEEFDIEQTMYAIEKLEEANIRFQNLALSQAQFKLLVESKEEQHRDLYDLIVTIKGRK
jgi:hypothetical protein